ncbi:MAG: SRPBCC family protein [Actinobacteria bacterium]|nr:SRPBCC family protein [Actinomycetota bacterium]
MAKISTRRIVKGSQELVWHLIADFNRIPLWLPRVEKIEHVRGPARGVGREQKATMAGGIESHERVVAWDNARRYAFRVERQARAGKTVGGSIHNLRTDIDLRPSASNTEVIFTGSWSSGPLGWVKSLLLRSSIRQDYETALNNIAKLMETEKM